MPKDACLNSSPRGLVRFNLGPSSLQHKICCRGVAKAHLAEGTWISFTQNQHSSLQLTKPVQGEEKPEHLTHCLVKGSIPQAREKMPGVWIPMRLTGKSGAMLLGLVKLKQLRKHLAEGCGCFQMERQLKAGFDGPSFGLRHLFLHGATFRDWREKTTKRT